MAQRRRLGVRRGWIDPIRDLLLFDGVALMRSGREALHEPDGERALADLEYLRSQGFVETVPGLFLDLESLWYTHSSADELDELAELSIAIDEGAVQFWQLDPSILERLILDRALSIYRHPSSAETLREVLPAGFEHLVSLCLRVVRGQETIPVLSAPLLPEERRIISYMLRFGPSKHLMPRDDLLTVVMSRLPEPRSDVPLEEVLDFSRSREMREARDRLLRHVERTALTGTEARAFALDLDDALAVYTEAVRLIDAKFTVGTVTLALSSTLGAIEELLRLRPSRAIQEVLSFKKMAADRVAAELSAPGREAALIYRARRYDELRS